jgi:hypothetical protein
VDPFVFTGALQGEPILPEDDVAERHGRRSASKQRAVPQEEADKTSVGLDDTLEHPCPAPGQQARAHEQQADERRG